MHFHETRRIQCELGIVRRCLLRFIRSQGWDLKSREPSKDGKIYSFSIPIPRRLPFRMRTSISVRIALSRCDSYTGADWTQVEHSDDLLRTMLRMLIPLCPIGLGISLLALLWGMGTVSELDSPFGSVILLVLFGLLINAGTVSESCLLERDHYKRRVTFWQELTKNARECATIVDDTLDEKFAEPFLYLMACIFSFTCAVFLLALGMALQEATLLAVLIFLLPMSMWLVSRRLSWRESPRFRKAVSLASDSYVLGLIVLTPIVFVYWASQYNAQGLRDGAQAISQYVGNPLLLKFIEKFSGIVVMLILLLFPFGLPHACLANIEQYTMKGRDIRSIASRGMEIPSSSGIRLHIVRLLAMGLSVYSLGLTYLGLAYMLSAVSNPSKLWLVVKEITAPLQPIGVFIMVLIFAVSLLPLILFMVAWLFNVSRDVIWFLKRPIKGDSGSEFFDTLTHSGMFQEVKAALGARYLAVYKDPNPSGEYYFARQAAWSGIGRCHGLAVDLAAIAKFTRENRETEAIIWHEVGHMVGLSPKLRLIARVVCLWSHSRISAVFQDSLKRELAADEFVTSAMGTCKPLRSVLVRISQALVGETSLQSQKKLSIWKALWYVIFSTPDLTYVHPHYELRCRHLATEDAKQKRRRREGQIERAK